MRVTEACNEAEASSPRYRHVLTTQAVLSVPSVSTRQCFDGGASLASSSRQQERGETWPLVVGQSFGWRQNTTTIKVFTCCGAVIDARAGASADC